MGKPLPTPYPGQSIEEYREQLVNFRKNYWSFLKPSKGGSKFIPLPPEHLNPNNKQNKTKEMSSKKLNEHVEEELFNKEKRVIPNVPPEYRVKLNEGVDPKKVIKTTPKIVKESVLGSVEPKMDKEYTFGSVPPPVKKKKPYYRKKYTKPTPVEVIDTSTVSGYVPEPVNKNLFIKGLLIGIVVTAIICHIIYSI